MTRGETVGQTNKYRLPTNVIPEHCELVLDVSDLEYRLTTDEDGNEVLEQNPYTGTEEWDLKVLKPTDRIVLNANEVTVTDARLNLAGGAPVDVTGIEHDGDLERVTIALSEPLPEGTATLRLDFESVLATPTDAVGLYQSVYELDGEKCLMATTQCEATDARRWIPCFDEPEFKSTFRLTVIAPAGKTVLSNTDPVDIDCGLDVKRVTFAKTPKMSTYLLALIIGDLASVETTTKNGTTVRIWAVPDERMEMTGFALEHAKNTLEFLEDYCGVPYPLSKLDNVAIPDFKWGAMENWGLVTYREHGLLVPESASINAKKWATGVIPHEYKHQWFGNLVTMRWWDNLWLNESFATFVGDLCVDALFPKWNWWDEFVAGDTIGGMSLDSLRNSHPIEVPVEDARQIQEIFDAISYSKGASVLRMLHEYVGAEQFRQGVVTYLKRHAYGNTVTNDFLSAIEEASDRPVVDVFTTWIGQTGHPVVTVERDGRTITVTQERFLLDRDPDAPEQDGSLWPIPLRLYEVGTDVVQETLMTTRSAKFTLEEPGSVVLLNPGRVGFYRVNYDKASFDAIREAVATKDIGVSDRLGIFDDAYMLMRAGYLPVWRYLELVDAARDEDSFLVWKLILKGLDSMADIFSGTPAIDAFKAWALERIAPLVEQLGWEPAEDEEEGVTRLRPIVLSAAARFGDEAVAQTAAEHLADNSATVQDFVNATPPDLRRTVLSIAMRSGDTETLGVLQRLQHEAEEAVAELPPDIMMSLLVSMGASTDEVVLEDALAYALSDKVRGNDALAVFHGIDVEMKQAAWAFLTEHWDVVFDRYGEDVHIGGFIGGAAGGTASAAFADEVEAFFEANPTPAAARMISQLLEATRLRATFLEQNADALTQFFASENVGV